MFVKLKLIQGVSNKGDTLIDYAVGMAGDLPKWIRSKLKFVFGVDMSKDNIMNQLKGACARYLKANKKFYKTHFTPDMFLYFYKFYKNKITSLFKPIDQLKHFIM